MMPPFGKGTIGQPPMPGGDQNAMMAMMMDNINMSQAMGSAPMMLPPPMLMGGMGPAGAPNPMMMPGAMGPAGPAFMGPRPPPGMPPPPRPPPLTPDAPPPKHPPIPQAQLSAAAPKPVMGPVAPGIRPPSAPPTEPPNKLRRLDGPSGASQAMGPAGAKDMAISNGTAGVRAGSAGPPGARAAVGGPSPPSTAGKGPGIMHPNPAVRAEARYIERVRTICGILNIGAAQALSRERPDLVHAALASVRTRGAYAGNVYADDVSSYLPPPAQQQQQQQQVQVQQHSQSAGGTRQQSAPSQPQQQQQQPGVFQGVSGSMGGPGGRSVGAEASRGPGGLGTAKPQTHAFGSSQPAST